jgi:hypothetical protein
MKICIIKPLLLIIYISIIIALLSCCKNSQNKSNIKLGGECVYKNYNGIAEIKSIQKSVESSMQASVSGGPGYEGFEVKFAVQVNDNINKEWIKEYIKKEQLFILANSWYPGIKYINKYNIKEGNKYNCNVKVIEKGTCTPVVIEIDRLDKMDYFESKQ